MSIAYLKGKIHAAPVSGSAKESEPVEIWVEVGGVGYSVKAAPGTAREAAGAEDKILYISQSSALYGGETTLYGFLSLEDRALFELLRDLPGVGARKALEYFEKIASKSPDRFLDAVSRGDSKTLSGVYGFSPKTAAKMAAELKDKASVLSGTYSPARKRAGVSPASGSWVDGGVWDRARSALISLGFASSDAEASLNEAAAKLREKETGAGSPQLEQLIKEALKELSLAR